MSSYLNAARRASQPTGENSFPRAPLRRTIYTQVSVIGSGRLGRILTTGLDSTTALSRWQSLTYYVLTSMKLSVGGLAANLAFEAVRTLRPPAVGYRAAIFGHERSFDVTANIVDNMCCH